MIKKFLVHAAIHKAGHGLGRVLNAMEHVIRLQGTMMILDEIEQDIVEILETYEAYGHDLIRAFARARERQPEEDWDQIIRERCFAFDFSGNKVELFKA